MEGVSGRLSVHMSTPDTFSHYEIHSLLLGRPGVAGAAIQGGIGRGQM